MPLSNDDLQNIRGRVLRMFMDTIKTIEVIEENSDVLYGESADEVRAAINEYLDDFIRNTGRSGEIHPETSIYNAPKEAFQRAGLYGAQLALKERHVTQANAELRKSMTQRVRSFFRSPFK